MGSAAYDKFLSNFTSYRSITKLFDMYSIAEEHGVDSVKRLFDSHFDIFKTNYRLLTELVMVLNHRLFICHEKDTESPIVSAYDKIFKKAHRYALSHLKGDELRYYLDVTD